MRIAFVVHDYHRAGGHSRYVAELATRFAKEHEVHVFANRIAGGNEVGIRFHRVPALRTNALTTVLTFAFPVTFQIDRHFDIVHSQGFCGLRGNVFTAHICNRAWDAALKKFGGGTRWRESIFNTFATALEYLTYRFARNSVIIAISERVARDIERFYHCRSSIRVIHHGVDLHMFNPSNKEKWRKDVRALHRLSETDTVFLYVGDLRKGAKQCLLALSQLDAGKLHFVSRSPAGVYGRMAQELGLADRVIFSGPTDRVEQIYAAADAFVLPTPYDAFGMVISEAMASGLAVIASREAGASEIIQHGMNGLLLNNVNDTEELAGHMRSLLRDPNRASMLGRAARKSVERLSWDAVADETMLVYEAAVQTSRSI